MVIGGKKLGLIYQGTIENRAEMCDYSIVARCHK